MDFFLDQPCSLFLINHELFSGSNMKFFLDPAWIFFWIDHLILSRSTMEFVNGSLMECFLNNRE